MSHSHIYLLASGHSTLYNEVVGTLWLTPRFGDLKFGLCPDPCTFRTTAMRVRPPPKPVTRKARPYRPHRRPWPSPRESCALLRIICASGFRCTLRASHTATPGEQGSTRSSLAHIERCSRARAESHVCPRPPYWMSPSSCAPLCGKWGPAAMRSSRPKQESHWHSAVYFPAPLAPLAVSMTERMRRHHRIAGALPPCSGVVHTPPLGSRPAGGRAMRPWPAGHPW